MKHKLGASIAFLLTAVLCLGWSANALAADGTDVLAIYAPETMEYDLNVNGHLIKSEAYYWDAAWTETAFVQSARNVASEARYQSTEGGEWITGTFKAAVQNVYAGGTIELMADIYLTETITLNRSMTITSEKSGEPKMITCAVDGHGYLLMIAANITLKDVIVDGGYKPNDATKIYGSRALIAVGGQVDNQLLTGQLTLKDGAEIRNNYNATVGGAGGGVCLIKGSIFMEGGSIHDNFACSGGGVAIVQEKDNQFSFTGGAIEDNTAVTMYNTRTYTSGWKYQIRAGGFGGGIAISAGKLIVNGGSVRNNTSQPLDLYKTNTKETPNEEEWYSCEGGFGGGIAMYSSSPVEPEVIIQDSVIEGNEGFYGGAMYVDWGSVEITGSEIKNNSAASKVVREPNAAGGYTEDRYGGHGGGVYLSYGRLSMADSRITSNSADYYGGGIFQLQGGVNSNNSNLSSASELRLEKVLISQNKAHSCAGMYISGSNKSEWNGTGGSWGTTRLIDTEITRNNAVKKGGGVLVAPYQDVIISGGVKVYDNAAPDHSNFLFDNDIEWDFPPGRFIVEAPLTDALIYADVCEHTTPYSEVKQLIATGTQGYSITPEDFAKFRSDNELFTTLYDVDNYVYLVPSPVKLYANINMPQTGDSTNVCLYLTTLALSAMGMGMLRQRTAKKSR